MIPQNIDVMLMHAGRLEWWSGRANRLLTGFLTLLPTECHTLLLLYLSSLHLVFSSLFFALSVVKETASNIYIYFFFCQRDRYFKFYSVYNKRQSFLFRPEEEIVHH